MLWYSDEEGGWSVVVAVNEAGGVGRHQAKVGRMGEEKKRLERRKRPSPYLNHPCHPAKHLFVGQTTSEGGSRYRSVLLTR